MSKEKIRNAIIEAGLFDGGFTENLNTTENNGHQSIDIDAVRAEVEQILNQPNQASNNLFVVKTANKWMKESKYRPAPKRLFGDFWFENEVCILFSDTNLGKSILAVQIAESIASGKQFDSLFTAPEAQRVLYFDFELSDKQFESRYATQSGEYFDNHYEFSENFHRAEINSENLSADDFSDFDDFLTDSIEKLVAETGIKVVIIDNITYLKNGTEKSTNAIPLVKKLKALARKYNLSILLLAHTPKRDLTKPLSQNDLQGSKMIINFVDSTFAIGKSNQDELLRYLKQIKVRNAKFTFDTDNVWLCQIVKPDNFLHFEMLDFANEREHLKVNSDKVSYLQ